MGQKLGQSEQSSDRQNITWSMLELIRNKLFAYFMLHLRTVPDMSTGWPRIRKFLIADSVLVISDAHAKQ